MKIVLLKNIPDLGNQGETKDVKRGYALNFLLPNNLAAVPGTVVIKVKDKKKEVLVKQQDLKKLESKLKDLSISFKRDANEKGTLYASVDKQAVEELLKQNGVKTKVHDLNPAHLKTVGTHKVEMTVDNGVKTEISIKIDSN